MSPEIAAAHRRRTNEALLEALKAHAKAADVSLASTIEFWTRKIASHARTITPKAS